MKPICMYKVTSICKPCSVKGTTVYGQVLSIVPNFKQNSTILDVNEDKIWVELDLACVEFDKKKLYNAFLSGYDDYRKNLFKNNEYHVYGKVKALINAEGFNKNELIGAFVKISDVTWLTEYGKANTYYLTRFSKPIMVNNKQVFPFIALDIERKQGTEKEFVDIVECGKIKENKGTLDNPICGVEDYLPERPQPSAISVDSEYQPIQSAFSSLSSNIKRIDGTTAVMSNDAVVGADLGVFGEDEEDNMPFMKRNVIEERAYFKEFNVNDIVDEISISLDKLNNEYENILGNAEELCSQYDVPYSNIASAIKNNWDRKPEGLTYARTGKKLFLEAVEKVLPELGKHTKNNESEIDTLVSIYGNRIVDVWSGREGITDETECLSMINKKRYDIYLVMLKGILGLRCDLLKIYESTDSNQALMNYIIEVNPYVLSYIHSNTSLKDMDRLAMFTNNFASDDQILYRGIASLTGFMKGTIKNMSDNEGSSVFSYSAINKQAKEAVNFNLSKTEYDNLIENGSILPSGKLAEYIHYINKGTSLEEKKKKIIGNTEWQTLWDASKSRKLKLSDGSILNETKVISKCIETGICTEIERADKFYADTKILEKNLYIYTKLKDINENAKAEPVADLALTLNRVKFESIKQKEYGDKPFHLEDQQAKALKLLYNGVMAITGEAGSGKTTTAEALVYVLENLYNINDSEILFVAPTGKAANRLKEVVKKTARTIHSAFRIGIADDYVNEMTYTNKAKAEVKKKVVIVDECSMISLDLMYTMLKVIDESTRVIFLGDIEQLPPISVGKPFSDILHFVPTIVLQTSKRAAEDSIISKNANLLIKTREYLVEGKDFKIVNSIEDDAIISKLTEMCYFYRDGRETSVPVVESMRGIGLQDVQIITPYKKKQYKSGTINLNNVLHDIYNPYDVDTYKVVIGDDNSTKPMEFRVGDRVIHTENDSTRKHYTVGENNLVNFVIDEDAEKLHKFVEALNAKKKDKDATEKSTITNLMVETGVMNGDVGYITKIEHIRNLYAEDDKVEESLYEGLDSSKLDKTFVIFVKYQGIGDEGSYEIAYPFYAKSVEGNVIKANATAIEHLDLAFALTVHKMQGSQAKMIIVVWPNQKLSLLTRNMLYTAITRATDGVALLGSVKGENNSVEYARTRDAMARRLSLMDL